MKEEWELAARYIEDANSDGDIEDTDEYYPGDYASGATDDYNDNSSSQTHLIAQKTANALDLHDMRGIVNE